MPLIGNKVVEKDLREYLNAHGYSGHSAVLRDVNLVAIQRPGWTQIFSFRVRAKAVLDENALDDDVDEPDDAVSSDVGHGWHEFYGACLDDERYGRFDVVLCADRAARDAEIAAWSGDEMIQLERTPLSWLQVGLLCLFVLVMAFTLLSALVQ